MALLEIELLGRGDVPGVHGHLAARINGVEYQRLDWGGGHIDEFWANEEADPAIVCQCGNTVFTLTYGEFSLRATCPECHRSEVVYSG